MVERGGTRGQSGRGRQRASQSATRDASSPVIEEARARDEEIFPLDA